MSLPGDCRCSPMLATNKTLGFIPEDDRPVSCQQPMLLANAAGYRLLTPPLAMLGHRNNAGRCDQIGRWLLDNWQMADGWVIAIDMLVYGGLVASRELRADLATCLHRLQIMRRIPSRLPALAFQPIRRLAPTVRSSKDLATWAKQHNEGGPEENRRRNHLLNMAALDLLADRLFEYLALLQEDARPNGPQQAEQDMLRAAIADKKLADRVTITTGTDEGGLVMLARLIAMLERRIPRARVEFSSAAGAQRVALFEERIIGDSVLGQLQAAGVRVVQGEEACDFTLCVWCPDRAQRDLVFAPLYDVSEIDTGDMECFVSRIAQHVARGERVVLADLAYGNGGDPALMSRLAQTIRWHQLAGYSGWNTAANAVGYAVAQGVLASDSKEFLLLRLLEDWGYQTVVRPQLVSYVKEELHEDVWCLSRQGVRKAQRFLRQRLDTWYRQNLSSHFPAGLPELEAYLPWARTFEVDIRWNKPK